MEIHRAREAIGQLSDETKDHHPEIGWSSPVRMRNRIVHGYCSTDLDILVTTARDDLGAFLDARTTGARWTDCTDGSAARGHPSRRGATSVERLYVEVVLIAEELLLLALDPAKGTVHLGMRSELHRALALALAAELAIGGRLSYDGNKLDVVAGDPPADPLLAEALDAVTERLEQGWNPMRVLGSLDKDLGGVWSRLVDRLVAAGTIVEERHGVLPARHPVSDPALHDVVLSRARAAAAVDGPLDPRDAVLLAYGFQCALLDRVAPERSQRQQAKARMEHAMEVASFSKMLRSMTQVTPDLAPGV